MGLYRYKVVPFGLKNAGATYQRLVNLMFQKQIGNNMEVYVDDMLVKSKKVVGACERLGGVLQRSAAVQNEAQPAKVFVWSRVNEISGIHCKHARHRSEP